MFYLTAAATFVFALLGVRSPLLYWLFTLPGTFVHELAHWLVAFLTGARPGFPSLVPHKRDEGGWVLGSVTFRPGWLSGGLVSLAPVYLMPPLALWVYRELSAASGMAVQGGGGYLFAVLVLSCWPSRADLGIAFRYPMGSLLVLGVAYLVSMGAIRPLIP